MLYKLTGSATPTIDTPADNMPAVRYHSRGAGAMLLASLWATAALSPPPLLGPFDITWYAPFQSGGGYCSEAYAFAGVMKHLNMTAGQFVGIPHGDSYNKEYLASISLEQRWFLGDDFRPARGDRETVHIIVCHSEPGAWHAPYPKYYTKDCPPVDSRGAAASRVFRVGRTMFETDSIPDGWVSRLNFMDEIWVPSRFQKDIFVRRGVKSSRVRVVAEPVDTDFFRPLDSPGVARDGGTNFLFVGKWEERKGLRILLRAFLREFAPDEDTRLTVLTSAYHSTSDFWGEIVKFVQQEDLYGADAAALHARISVVSNVPQADMPALYSAATALVIPSRGEGWGRPHVEAMACGLPVVATNWSGPAVYLDDAVGYPLRVDGMVDAGGWKGHRWADPSESHLRQILRQIHSSPAAALAKGAAARQKMVDVYSVPVFAEIMQEEIKRIVRFVEGRNSNSGEGSEL